MNTDKPVRPIRRDELRKFKHTVVVFGSRGYKDYAQFESHVIGFINDNELQREDTVFISGLAKGPDTMIVDFAKANGWRWCEMPADWSNIDVPGAIIKTNAQGQYNARAGHTRNAEMANVSSHGLGFWNGVSPGTKGMVELCHKQKIVLRVIRITD